ncbi:hypothetical protein ACQPYH_02350 [Kribbella sp. CA-245084]|uniref:hypothetical protein n=1 Tax=Kribbella sp. CA-245084 TaxID=3239940 RepID=UPI003D91E2C7
MTRNINWPGRGPTWIGVPALVAMLFGGLMLLELDSRVSLSRELLAGGAESVASSVEVEVDPGKGSPLIGEVRVVFAAPERGQVRAVLKYCEDDRQGMPEGVRPPAPGTRYAKPLQVLYRPSDPSTALAAVDAREWIGDRRTPRIGWGLVVGGSALVLLAMVLLTIGARRRGLSWWQWYTEGRLARTGPQ